MLETSCLTKKWRGSSELLWLDDNGWILTFEFLIGLQGPRPLNRRILRKENIHRRVSTSCVSYYGGDSHYIVSLSSKVPMSLNYRIMWKKRLYLMRKWFFLASFLEWTYLKCTLCSASNMSPIDEGINIVQSSEGSLTYFLLLSSHWFYFGVMLSRYSCYKRNI